MEKDSYYYYQLGQEYLGKEEVLKALNCFLFSAAIERHFKTYERIYECCNILNYKDEAMIFIELAYNENRKNDKVALLYAKSLIEQQDKENAKRVLQEILQTNPTYVPAVKEYQQLK